ncbi:MAG: DMT family transporter [Thermodesulfobacteriota bacterium]
MNSRKKGLLLMIAAGLCWSTSGILVRQVKLPDPWEIIFWRSIFMVIFILGLLLGTQRQKNFWQTIGANNQVLLAGAFYALTFFFFILSITRNTAANTFVLMSISPFIAALMGRIFLKELLPFRTWFLIVFAFLGIILMFYDGLDSGYNLGNILALGVPLAFSLNLMVLRRAHARVNMIPMVFFAGVFSILISFPLAWPLTPNLSDLTFLWIMGWIQLGLGSVLMTIATRYLTAAEVAFFALLETTLGPIWVWLGIGERPSNIALIGGIIVVLALLLNALQGLPYTRKISNY